MLHKVLIIGVGGVGSYVCEFLGRALRNKNVEITLMDFDKVEEKNLFYSNYEQKDIGRPKATALATRMSNIGVKIEMLRKKLESPYDLEEWFDQLVIVCTDDFMSRKLVHDNCEQWIDVRAEGDTFQIFTHKSKLAKEFIGQDLTARGSCQNNPYERVHMGHAIAAGIATEIALNIMSGEEFLPEVFGKVFKW